MVRRSTMTDGLAELLGSMLGPAPPRPRRKPQRFPHKARLDAEERAIADEHGLEVWRDFKPIRGCCPCGYNIYRAGTHPDNPNPFRPQYLTLQDEVPDYLGRYWAQTDVHRSEVLELLETAARHFEEYGDHPDKWPVKQTQFSASQSA